MPYLTIIADPRDQARDERRARRQLLDDDVLMERVRPVAERAKTVKCWDAKRGGEVPVRRAARRALRRASRPIAAPTSRASA